MEQHVLDVLNKTKLNWEVETQPIQTGSGIIIPNSMAIVRTDTQEPLAIHSSNYVPYQNHELVELLHRVSQQTGLEIHRGGYFGQGERVYIQLKSNDLRIGNDKVEGYLTGINSFDGSTSLAFGPSSITISCSNTFYASFKQLNSKVRHTKNMVVRIDEICFGIDKVLQQEQRIFDNIKKMSEVSIPEKITDDVVRMLFGIDKKVDIHNEEELSTRTKNNISKFHVDLNGELRDKGENLWGLFSGVTKYTTHSISKKDNSLNKMFDLYGKREKEIFNHVSALV